MCVLLSVVLLVAPGGDANRSEKSVVMMHYLKKVQKCQLFYQ